MDYYLFKCNGNNYLIYRGTNGRVFEFYDTYLDDRGGRIGKNARDRWVDLEDVFGGIRGRVITVK